MSVYRKAKAATSTHNPAIASTLLPLSVYRHAEAITHHPAVASNPDYIATKFPGIPAAELAALTDWGKTQMCGDKGKDPSREEVSAQASWQRGGRDNWP